MRTFPESHRSRLSQRCLLLAVVVGLTGCGGDGETTFDDSAVSATAFDWRVPAGTPLPLEPLDNPMTEAKFELGRHLFFDRRLSGNGSQACVDCHLQSLGFTDGVERSLGSTGQRHPRNAQPLLNVAYHATKTWGNPSLLTLEQQILVPLFGEAPVEQGLTEENLADVLERLRSDPVYPPLFEAAFPETGSPLDTGTIVKALASFVRGMVSFETAFDRYERGDSAALSASAQRGRALFFSEDLECFHCHGGYNLSDSTLDRTMSFVERPFHNTGLFNIGGTGDYPDGNQGIFEITGDPSDMGKFRAPSLRNVALTAPYMHDGSMADLETVLEFYAAGGRLISSGENAGDGRVNPFKDSFVNGFTMTEQDKSDLMAFLESLTDVGFITDPRFSNPWQAAE
ncbi:MbnH family di-heme enzyme [Marinobacter mobilis]|uniref:MbnH family di-heme enzyme n=1 Tax=Marinobacter mobilis TaxID=488533 RepID=UPI0035C6998C